MQKLKILWLSHFVPYPPKGGCFQRSYNLIKRVGAKHDVHLVAMRHKKATHPEAELRAARAALERHCRSVDVIDISTTTTRSGLFVRALTSLLGGDPVSVSIYRSSQTSALLRSLRSNIDLDILHFDTIGLAQYLEDVGGNPAVAVMTHHGAEAYMMRRRIRREPNPLKKFVFFQEWRTLERYERKMCGRFAANIVMSDLDGRIMQRVAPDATFTTVSNGVDVDYFTPVESRGSKQVVFAGRLDQYSNRDGILHFMNAAWPRISERYADAAIDIVGMNPPEALQRLSARDARVRVHGFVPDIRPFFREAAAAICPVRDGGGTRIKILDALAQGVPMVSTAIGCEGIAVVPERDVLIADTPDEFASQIGRVFEDEALRSRLAANGRAVVEANYSWNALAERLIELYHALVDAKW